MYLLETAAIMAATALFAILLFGYLHLRNEKRRKGLKEMAGRNAWDVQRISGQLGTRARTQIRPLNGEPWQVAVRTIADTNDKAPQRSVTEFTAPDAGISAGVVVLGPPLPPGTADMAGSMMHALDGPLGRRLLTRLTGPLDLDLTGLTLAAADHDFPGTVLATPGSAADLPFMRLAQLLGGWTRDHPGERFHPVIILSQKGLMVRVRDGLQDPGPVEAFIIMAQAMREVLRQSRGQPA